MADHELGHMSLKELARWGMLATPADPSEAQICGMLVPLVSPVFPHPSHLLPLAFLPCDYLHGHFVSLHAP